MVKDNLGHARIPLQIERMKEAAQKGICCFCREHFESYHTASIEYENDSWLITKNDFPYGDTQEHLLIVVKRHISNPCDLTADEWIHFGEVMKYFNGEYQYSGGSLVMRFGDTSFTGATIMHLHAHIVVGGQGKPGDEKLTVIVGYKAPK